MTCFREVNIGSEEEHGRKIYRFLCYPLLVVNWVGVAGGLSATWLHSVSLAVVAS